MIQSSLEDLRALENPLKGVRFQVCNIKVENLGALYKTKVVGDPEAWTFDFMKKF